MRRVPSTHAKPRSTPPNSVSLQPEPAATLPATGSRLRIVAPVETPAASCTPSDANGEKPGLSFDAPFHAAIARASGGLSPTAAGDAYADWLQHLLLSPDKQLELMQKFGRKWQKFLPYLFRALFVPESAPCIAPLPQDKRFSAEAWQRWPFNVLYQSFLFTQQWWHNATTGVPGVSRHHEEMISFISRQLLDVASPSNFPLTNPEIIEKTLAEGGANLLRGWNNFTEDAKRLAASKAPVGAESFRVGENVALTKGKVVYRNRLIELIQYAPATAEVYAEPVLIVPAWIMKYYILDLSPENSLVRYLVSQGHTVFAISWKNPGEAEKDLGLEDYRCLGVMAALDAISAIVPGQKIHALGYCLGGTLLAIAAAAMARDGDERLKSLTLLAAQADFTEAGELSLFIDEDQVRFLEDMMAERGYLDSRQMAGAFQLLRSNDLIWSTMVRQYLMGERAPMNDLMAWNADATRMPYRMHSEYLRHLFLENDLAEGRFRVGEKAISLRDIDVPIFAVSTLSDHVAPWRSVYKIQTLTEADVTFVLSSGGHNAGIVNPPGPSKAFHQIATHREKERHVDADAWQMSAVHHDGSWWPCWLKWLAENSSAKTSPPPMGSSDGRYTALCDAPGTYVLES